MATKLYLRATTSTYGTGDLDARLGGSAHTGWSQLALSTTPGAGSIATATANALLGPTNGIEVGSTSTTPRVWYSEPLDADITISGSITWNIWAAENAMTDNCAVNGVIEVIDGATGVITNIDTTTRTTEVATTTRAVNNFSETPAAGVACKRGDRLRVRIFMDDVGTMAAGGAFTVSYDSPTPAVDGDTWLQLTENLTFVSEPAGTTIYLTDTASAVSTASVDREAWTSRGAGVQNDVRNTTAGYTAPLQWTDTAGGTVVDWFTRQLAAFTLGGAVRVNARALESNAAANSAVRCEIARVASDGTSPAVWGVVTSLPEIGTTESDRSFLVSGDDLAVSDGQRLRIRFYLDDGSTAGLSAAMGAGQTATLFYAGTSGGASGDTYLTFTQTLTEFTAGTTVTPTTAALVITRNIPTVTASDHQLVTPTTKSLTATAFAPTVSTPELATPTTVSLTTATFAPAVVTGGAYVTAVLADSPVAFWRMGEASGSVLDSIGSNHGTTTGSVTRDVAGALGAGQDDGALTFDGSTGYIVIGDVLDITVGTYEVWFKTTAPVSTTQYIMYKQAGQPNLYFHTDGSLRVSDNNVEWIITASTAYDDGAWHHAVFTHPGGATLGLAKLYIDGVDVTVSYNGATLTPNSSDLGFGGLAIVPFNGSIDEAAIYNSVLSPTRVLAHYNAGIGPQVATPTTKALTLATFAPTITATEHQAVTPTTRALTLATFAPAVTTPELVTPTTKALALAAFAPVVTATDVQLVTPATAAIVLSAFAPTIALTDHQLVTPTTKSAVLTTFAPTVTAPDHQTLTPSNAAVTLATFAPTVTSAQHQTATPITATLSTASFAPAVSTSDHQAVTPTTTALTLTANAPVVTTPILAIPSTTALVVTKNAPTVSTPETVTPTTKALTLSTFAPTVTNPQTYVPTTAALVTTKYAPIVDVTAASTIVVPNATLTITRNVAEVSATAHLAVTPQAATLTVTQFAPTVTATAHEVVTPSVKSLIAATFAPTVSTSDQQGIVPGKATLTLATFAPTVSATAHVAVIPSTKVLQLQAFAPTARVANYAIPTTAGLSLSQFAPLVSATQNAYVEIVPNALTITEYAPVLSITGHADIVPLNAELHLALFPPTAEQHSITPLPINIYGFAVVAMGDSAGVEGENGGATVRSEGGGTTVSTSGPSARVTVR